MIGYNHQPSRKINKYVGNLAFEVFKQSQEQTAEDLGKAIHDQMLTDVRTRINTILAMGTELGAVSRDGDRYRVIKGITKLDNVLEQCQTDRKGCSPVCCPSKSPRKKVKQKCNVKKKGKGNGKCNRKGKGCGKCCCRLKAYDKRKCRDIPGFHEEEEEKYFENTKRCNKQSVKSESNAEESNPESNPC